MPRWRNPDGKHQRLRLPTMGHATAGSNMRTAAWRFSASMSGTASGSPGAAGAALLHAVQGAQLVAIGIAHVGQVQGARGTFAQAGRLFAGVAAVGDGDLMELFDLFGRAALEADGAAVGAAGSFAVDGLAHAKGAAVVAVEQALVAAGRRVLERRARPQQGVIELLGTGDVVGTDHDVTEHCVSLKMI